MTKVTVKKYLFIFIGEGIQRNKIELYIKYIIVKNPYKPYSKLNYTSVCGHKPKYCAKGMGSLNRKGFPLIILTGQIFLTMAAVTLLNPDCNKKSQIILAGLFFYIAGLITVNFFTDQNESLSARGSIFKVFQLLRHDFQNHLQVLYSMIQLKKYEDALKYIDDVKNSDETVNYICNNLTDIPLICCLLEMLYHLRQKDINMTVEVIGKSPYSPQLSRLKREIEHFILQFDKIQGKKDIKVVLRNAKVEMLSEAIGEKVIYGGKHIA